MGWTDTHAHLADESLADQIDLVLERAARAGVSRILCVAVDARTSEAAIKIAEKYPQVWATVGIHPNYANQAAETDWDRIRDLASHPRVCALGETGLDLHWDDCPFPIQQANFARHWQLSRDTQLPLIIHMRDCEPEMLQALEEQQAMQEQSAAGALRGVMHSFAGSTATAGRCLSLGLYISFAGMLTYKKSVELRETAKKVPMDRLLVETDSPYLSPEPYRSRRPNEPAHVVFTGKCLAETIETSAQVLAEKTSENASRLFWKMM
jgi:TatD DNase family protein